MTHIEAFDAVLKNHGYNYRTLSMREGVPENYIFRIIHNDPLRLTAKAYSEKLALMGAVLVAVKPGAERSLDDILSKEIDKHGTRIETYRLLLEIGGWRLCVKDGEDLYYLT